MTRKTLADDPQLKQLSETFDALFKPFRHMQAGIRRANDEDLRRYFLKTCRAENGDNYEDSPNVYGDTDADKD